jgi:hypothetical protein
MTPDESHHQLTPDTLSHTLSHTLSLTLSLTLSPSLCRSEATWRCRSRT